jgi:hypothetical protein
MIPLTLGQMLLGTEGLALLRLAATDDAAARDARVAEIRSLVARYDAELSAPLGTPEYGFQAGYRLWSATYEPLRLFRFCQVSRHRPWQTRAGLAIWPALMAGWMGMRYVACGSEAVTERPERTAQGYRRFRCRACGKQSNGHRQKARRPWSVRLGTRWR